MDNVFNSLEQAVSRDDYSLEEILRLFYSNTLDELLETLNEFLLDNINDLIGDRRFFLNYHEFLYNLSKSVNESDDLIKIRGFVNSNIKLLKDHNKKYNKGLAKKDNEFHLTKIYIGELSSNLSYLDDLIQNKLGSDDFHMIWFVISSLKNPDYLFYLFNEYPDLLNLDTKEGKRLFAEVCNYYLVNLESMDSEDIQYYKRIIVMMLENSNLEVRDQELVDIIKNANRYKSYRNNVDKKNIDFLINEIKRHYQTLNGNALVTCVDRINESCPEDSFTNLFNRTKSERVDLRDQFTISIDRLNSAKMVSTLFDDAFSLEKSDNGCVILSVHVPDVDFYVKKDSETDLFMRNLGESVYARDHKKALLDSNIANLCSLKRGELRPAITFRMKIDSNGNIIDIDFLESIVRVNYNLTTRNALTFMSENSDSRLFILNDMYSIAKEMRKVRKETIGKRSKSNIIIDEFNIAPDMATAEYCLKNGIVFPYKNFKGKKSPFNHRDVISVSDFISENDFTEEQQHTLMSIFDSFHRVYYDVVNRGNKSFDGRAVGNVGNPLREYISLETLRLIKDLIINKENNEDYWRERIERDCIEFTETSTRIKTLYK